MIDFIVKYWLQVLFGLIAAGLGFMAKHYYGLWKKEKENKQNQILDSIKEELKTYNQEIVTQKEALLTSEDVRLQEAIKKVEESNNQLMNVVLGVYNKQFKNDCRYLLENVNNAEIFASFNIRSNIPYNASNPNGKSKQPHEYKDKMPISQKELFGSNKTGKRSLDDFLTRVQSISIPEIRASTTEIKVLNQTLTKPIPLLENDFTSSFTIEQDAGLEYMRLFNRLSGLSLMMEVNGEIRSSYNSKYGHYNNL